MRCSLHCVRSWGAPPIANRFTADGDAVVVEAQGHNTIAVWARSLALIDGKIDFYGEWVTTGTRPTREPALSQSSAKISARRKSEH